MGGCAFKVAGNHPVVSDERKGLNEDLTVVAGVGNAFQIAGHRRGEDDFAEDAVAVYGGAKALPLEACAVFK